MIEEPKTYASESCHAYRRDGTPCYEVPNKSKPGFMRPTTVRDMKRLDLLPSVSTVLGIVAKPGLTGWIKEQVALAASKCGSLEGESDAEWIAYVLRKADENMSAARDLGTEIHGAIEEYFMGAIPPVMISLTPYCAHVNAAVAALKDLGVWGQRFNTEKSFASPLGYGGKVDLSGKDECWVVDFKCVDRLDKKLDYPDRCQQLCAYGSGMYPWGSGTPNGVRLANIFISTSEPGKYLLREWSEEEKKKGWEVFQAALALWRAAHNYYP